MLLAMDEPSPRYLAEHFLLPRHLEYHQLDAIEAIERNDQVFFQPVWMRAGFQFEPELVHLERDGYRIGVITFPAPQQPTEAYLGIVVAAPGATQVRYFTWEASESIEVRSTALGEPIARAGNAAGHDTATTVIGEWRPTGHTNHGPGPAFTGDLVSDLGAVLARVLGVMGCDS